MGTASFFCQECKLEHSDEPELARRCCLCRGWVAKSCADGVEGLQGAPMSVCYACVGGVFARVRAAEVDKDDELKVTREVRERAAMAEGRWEGLHMGYSRLGGNRT